MTEVESLAHTMHCLEAMINQGKKKCSWDKQGRGAKAKWQGYAESVIRLNRRVK